jgi:uncharacterized protein (DUF433 family)
MLIAPRITADPDVLGGKPCIRGLRFPVRDLLELLANGVGPDEILADYPYLEPEDIPAALSYAASQIGHPVVIAAE